MKLHHGATSALALATALMASQAGAIGLDRSNQDITAIFEEGNVLELSFGKVFPDISGNDGEHAIVPTTDARYDSVGEDFTNLSGSVKFDVSPQVSMALIADQPFGADIAYSENPMSNLGGTTAQLDSHAITAVGRYKFNDNFSVHAGVRRETLSADIALSGFAYGPTFIGTNRTLNGYSVTLDESSANGYLVGAAYEKPEIALRVALTYNSAIEHEFDTTERLVGNVVAAGGTTEVETPESWNLDAQTGVAADTLVFANIRYAAYEDTRVSPAVFAGATGGASLTNIDDNYQMQVGVGRKLSDMFAVQAAIGFEAEGDERISPLDPTNGKRWVSLGGAYTMETVTISGGIRYTMLGDANPETTNPLTGRPEDRAVFNDNSAVAIGMSVAYRF
ncbi:outer membrane protein transport protein [Limimaricola variabilis]|uniref:OmpP1/FadL family transporter n=1 Tax=Limimaricola variabilis TaxID=1492771 RepID=UPI002AC930B0|nr:outer membrane protein transport protein [Limimaricola variabilis]WPY95234.1 outer membrane protein transport protein [Limimaricola variabilis]